MCAQFLLCPVRHVMLDDIEVWLVNRLNLADTSAITGAKIMQQIGMTDTFVEMFQAHWIHREEDRCCSIK